MTKAGIKPESVAEMDEAILKSLGVRSDVDAKKLVEHFLVPGGLVGPEVVMHALTAFVQRQREDEQKEDEEERAEREPSRAERELRFGGTGTSNGTIGLGTGTVNANATGGSSNDDAVKEYWERISGVIPDSVTSIWDKLEDELGKYNAVLKDRSNLIHGNDALKNQNAELKALLNQYLSAKINEELIVPPVSMPQQRKPAQTGSRNSNA